MTVVRLIGAHGSAAAKFMGIALGPQAVTDLRLVGQSHPNERVPRALAGGTGTLPALLVSYAYWSQFVAQRPRYAFRDYVLDSGAFTAKQSGGTVDLARYTEFCRDRLANDPQCAEVYALDVIGDWRASERNYEAMWKAGVPAIPAYHRGSPVGFLRYLASAAPKVALGGVALLKGSTKLKWATDCFATIYPKPIHGFGFMAPDILDKLPFHSVDASSWEMGPAAYGNYRSMPRPHRAPRGGGVNLRAEVEWYLALERRLKQRWASELARFPASPTAGWDATTTPPMEATT